MKLTTTLVTGNNPSSMFPLDDNTARHCTLSIRLGPDGFSFFVLDVNTNKVLHFKHSPIPFHQDTIAIALKDLREDDLFNFPFQEVVVLIDFPEATLVPSPLYDEEKKESLFTFNNDLAPREHVISNHCAAYGVEIVFSIPRALYEFFNKNYKKIKFIHKLSLLLNEANALEEKAQEQLFVSYSEEHLTAVGVRNNCLIYHNCFPLNLEEDLIYYLLLVFQELKFDQYRAHVLIDGPIDIEHPFVKVIQEYVKHIDFAEINKAYKYPSDFLASTPSHFFSSLFNTPQCAL